MRARKAGAGTERRGAQLQRLRVLITLLLVCAGASCARRANDASPEPAPIEIALHPAASRIVPAYVAVSGLDAADLSGLRRRSPTDPEWPSLLNITVAAGDDEAAADALPAVQGHYGVTQSTVTFTPLFPFDPGRRYRVVFDPSRLPRPRRAARSTAVVRLPAVATESTTVVTAVHPSADVLPENLLRVYIEFSAPMGSAAGLNFVKLVELSGDNNKTERVEPGAFLPIEADFWSPDHTRYTLFFDPGRVKQGIFPNRQSGRPLRAGHRYALDIAPAWTDANGLPLKGGYRHVFRAGPAVEQPIVLSDWTIARPAPGTRDPLVVKFRRPLDHGILVRAISIEARDRRPVEGEIRLEAHDAAWVFTPVAPWQGGEYNLVARPFLEDPEGNQIGRAFEAARSDAENDRVPGSSGADDAFRIAFTIGTP